MRDHVLFYVNGRRFEIRGDAAFASLTDFLREHLRQTGTKVVCAEGDCGACTVLVGVPKDGGLVYQTVDACIQFLYQLDGRHIVTVEGLNGDAKDTLHPVQKAMVECHGSQCGYCTPGFVMALAGTVETPPADMRIALTGNLCRCTGYQAILESAATLSSQAVPKLAERYPTAAIAADLSANAASPVTISTAKATFFAPRSLNDAIAFQSVHPAAAIVSGGTELGVVRNKLGLEPAAIQALTHIPGLGEIVRDNGDIVIGANVTWTQIENFIREIVPEFYGVVVRFGSPQIRNVATLAGNVANGSPIADSLPFLAIMGAELELVGPAGSRTVKLTDFYTGYKKKDLAEGEIIARIRVPLPAADDRLKLYKVSRRNDLDIATFGAAIRVRIAGEIITRAFVAYSGVAATVVRLPKTEAFLQGKLFSEDTFAEAGRVARAEITPISDVRGSRDFRWQLAENILSKFYFDVAEPATV